MFKQKNMLIIRGIPGSGKSTFAKIIMENYPKLNWAHFEADMFRYNSDGEYIFRHEDTESCHSSCLEYTDKSMVNGDNVIISNTFIKRWEMDAYLQLAEKYNYKVYIFKLGGKFENTHGVNKETIERMENNFQDVKDQIYYGPKSDQQ